MLPFLKNVPLKIAELYVYFSYILLKFSKRELN